MDSTRVKRTERRRPHAPPSPIMTTAEVAQYLRIHPSTVYKLVREGKLPAFKVGSDYRFNKSEIDDRIGEHLLKK
jgi:excisionase family DNA binding protein